MSKKMAYEGILLSLNAILLMLMNIIPVNTIFLMGLASLPISIIIMEWGPLDGLIFYVASIVLGFIVINSKIQWIIYIFTFGIYGLVKYFIERDRNIFIEYFLKVLFSNVAVLILYFIIKQFIYISINFITILSFEIIFIVYDNVYSRFINYYETKLRKMIKIKKDMYNDK